MASVAGRQIILSRSTLVAGGVGAVRFALERLGVETPIGLDLPDRLAAYRGRRVWRGNREEVRGRVDSTAAPVFVKPYNPPKAFRGRFVQSINDLIAMRVPDEMQVWLSEPVQFVSEWRFFVRHSQVVGVGHHSGDPLRQVDVGVVEAAIEDFGGEAPAAYGIDFGVSSDGRTRRGPAGVSATGAR